MFPDWNGISCIEFMRVLLFFYFLAHTSLNHFCTFVHSGASGKSMPWNASHRHLQLAPLCMRPQYSVVIGQKHEKRETTLRGAAHFRISRPDHARNFSFFSSTLSAHYACKLNALSTTCTLPHLNYLCASVWVMWLLFLLFCFRFGKVFSFDLGINCL